MRHDHDADALSIEAMHAADAPRITAHLARLSADDRALRFNSGLTDDAQIARYVGQMRFGEDLILGLVDADGVVVGLAHGCAFEAGAERRIEAAFSIDVGYRGRGLGTALMRSLQAAASLDRVASVVGVCAARNRPMRRIFERAGMALEREDDEIRACLALDAAASAPDGNVRSGRSGKWSANRSHDAAA
jgi:RimJ/RimL family protein N-acetyltransferase